MPTASANPAFDASPRLRAGGRVIVIVATIVVLAVFAASVLAYPLSQWLTFPYVRVLSRSLLVFVGLAMVLVWWRSHLNWSDIGYRGDRIAYRLGLSWLVGLLLVLPPVAVFFATGFRVRDTEVDPWSLTFAGFALQAVVSGGLVAVFEETLFRGFLQTFMARLAGWPTAMIVVSAAYASVHFLGIPDAEGLDGEHWFQGVAVVMMAFAPLAEPAEYWDSFVALFLLGVGLTLAKRVTGSIYVSIGLHAAFVFSIRILKEVTVRDIENQWMWLVGTYDHFVGQLVAVWLVGVMAMALALARLSRVEA